MHFKQNKILKIFQFLGGKNDSNDIVSEILKLDKESGSWMILGNMSAPRQVFFAKLVKIPYWSILIRHMLNSSKMKLTF